MIVSPFGLFDCSLQTDAAGAVIVTSSERAKDLRQKPVLIKGFGMGNNLSGWHNNDNLTHTGAIEAGKLAYSMAGLGPTDVDFAQIYDCFTYMVLVQLEDYGFCKKVRAVHSFSPALWILTGHCLQILLVVNFQKHTWKECSR